LNFKGTVNSNPLNLAPGTPWPEDEENSIVLTPYLAVIPQ
jgi:hypothetical protein